MRHELIVEVLMKNMLNTQKLTIAAFLLVTL
jgi:hypothetical protein